MTDRAIESWLSYTTDVHLKVTARGRVQRAVHIYVCVDELWLILPRADRTARGGHGHRRNAAVDRQFLERGHIALLQIVPLRDDVIDLVFEFVETFGGGFGRSAVTTGRNDHGQERKLAIKLWVVGERVFVRADTEVDHRVANGNKFGGEAVSGGRQRSAAVIRRQTPLHCFRLGTHVFNLVHSRVNTIQLFTDLHEQA